MSSTLQSARQTDSSEYSGLKSDSSPTRIAGHAIETATAKTSIGEIDINECDMFRK